MRIGLAGFCLLLSCLHPYAAFGETVTADFTSEEQRLALVQLTGPNRNEAVKETEDGFLITLPTSKSGRPQVGVESRFWFEGNFVATADYEIQASEKPQKGYGLGLMLRLDQDSSQYQRVVLCRFSHPSKGEVYATNLATNGTPPLNDEEFIDTTAMSGRLQIKRTGNTYVMSVAEGTSDFVEVRRFDFESPTVKKVRLLVDTGGATEKVEVLLKSLTVEADILSFSPFIPRRKGYGMVAIASMLLTLACLVMIAIIYFRNRKQKRDDQVETTAMEELPEIE